MFVNGHEQANIVKDYKNFLKRLEELKSYMVEFEKGSTMKLKIYPANCVVRGISNDKLL